MAQICLSFKGLHLNKDELLCVSTTFFSNLIG
jgi:hypothetical protein